MVRNQSTTAIMNKEAYEKYLFNKLPQKRALLIYTLNPGQKKTILSLSTTKPSGNEVQTEAIFCTHRMLLAHVCHCIFESPQRYVTIAVRSPVARRVFGLKGAGGINSTAQRFVAN